MGDSVTGGAGGIQACLEDLVAFSNLLVAAAHTVTSADHSAKFARLEIAGCSGLDFGPNNHQLDEILAGLSGSSASAHRAVDELRLLAWLVRKAAEDYGHADTGLLHMISSAIAELPGAVFEAGASLFDNANPVEAFQKFVTSDPALMELALVNGWALAEVGASEIDDGYPVVTDRGNDVLATSVTPPTSIGDLISELSVRNGGAAGEISVSFVYGGGRTRRVIVDIPGTKSWTPLPTSNVTSLGTNLRAITGAECSYEHGVLQAMYEAGVTSEDEVMLVGHSEGGMIAVNAARDATVRGAFRISHVVTAGAPIGHTVGGLPRSVQVLALEHRGDLVPRLDGAPNPDLPNVTTVNGGPDHGSVGANHRIEDSYLPLARSVDASDDPSVKAFLGSARGFFGQNRMTTERYVISRGY